MKDVTQSVVFTVECYAELDADIVRSDYGVQGSPVCYQAENIDYADITVDIAGVTVRLDALPKELRDALLESAIEAVDYGEWE